MQVYLFNDDNINVPASVLGLGDLSEKKTIEFDVVQNLFDSIRFDSVQPISSFLSIK